MFRAAVCRVLGLGVLLAGAAAAQRYVISTVAGGAPPPTPARGLDLSIGYAAGVTTDAAGNAYFIGGNCVFKLDQNGVVTRIAGNSRQGYSGDGEPATSAQLDGSNGVAVDAAGNLFILDSENNRVRKVSPSGIIATVAGNGTRGDAEDDGPATSVQLNRSTGVAADAAGNLFIAEVNRIRKVSPNGIITTVAGGGTDSPGDSGSATSARLFPSGVALDGAGNLFIADSGNKRVFKVTPGGIITTVAGNGGIGSSGDGGPATSAQLYGPDGGVAVDGAGNLFIGDYGRVRKVSLSGIITTVAGDGTYGFTGDGGPATSAQLSGPASVAVDGAGNLFIADYYHIRKVSPDGIIATVAGNGADGFDSTFSSVSGDGGPATSAQLNYPTGVAVDGAGSLFIAESGRIRKVSPNGIITTIAGDGTYGFSGDGGFAGYKRAVRRSVWSVQRRGGRRGQLVSGGFQRGLRRLRQQPARSQGFSGRNHHHSGGQRHTRLLR